MPHLIKVGSLLNPGVTQYEEMPEYNYRSGEHRLVIAMSHLADKEIEAVRRDRASFAFTVIKDVIIFQYRFGSVLPWSDAAYTWHKVPETEQQLPPELVGAQRALLQIILVEAATGVVKALRAVSFSPTFSNLLHRMIREQARRPLPDNYDLQVQGIFATYSSSQLRRKAMASCIGGDEADRKALY